MGFLFLSSLAITNVYAEKNHGLLKVPSPGLSLLRHSVYIKPVEANKKIQFIVWLKLRNQTELNALVQDIYNPESPHYQQFLTHEEYEQKFAPNPGVEQEIAQLFESKGMQVKIINHSVRVTGTAKQIQRLLNIKINYYSYHQSRVRANETAPRLSSNIAQYISGISGLSTLPLYQGNTNSSQVKDFRQDLHSNWSSLIPTAIPTTTSLNGFSGSQLQYTYNLHNIPTVNGTHLDGAGQTLVIVDGCDTDSPEQILKNANQYFNANNIPPFITSGSGTNFTVINPDGTPFTNCSNPTAYNHEIALDTQSSHTIAPGDNTVLVLADADTRTALMDVIGSLTQNNFTLAGFPDTYVISNSWSGVESDYDATLELSLQTAAAFGISVNFSSGDCGDNTYVGPVNHHTGSQKCSNPQSSQAVNYPGSSAYVTAVGATSIFVDQFYNYAYESVWGSVKHNDEVHEISYAGGTTGGISQYYGPVVWQSAISNYTAGGYGVINQNSTLRAVPDISMLGDPETGLHIYADGAQIQDGGTSLACPLFSATLVLVNQARKLMNKGSPIGHAAPYLYYFNTNLLSSRSLNHIVPPALIIAGATPPTPTSITTAAPSDITTPAPASAFTLGALTSKPVTYGWDSSLTIEPEDQFWNDAVGVGSPNLPNFVIAMANM